MQIQLPELQPEAERVSGSVESKRLPYELPVDLHLRRRREIVPLDRKRLLEIGSTCDHWESGRRRRGWADWRTDVVRSEEHTSELQSLAYLVCRLLLEKKNKRSRLEPRHRRRQPSTTPRPERTSP